MADSKRTPDGELLSDLSKQTKHLLSAWRVQQAKCRMLQEERALLETKIINALSDAADARYAYYVSLGIDEKNNAAKKGRKS